MSETKKIILDYVTTKGVHIINLEPNPNSIHSWALSYKDSINLCELCKDLFVPILGGDVVTKEKEGVYRFTYNNWSTQTKEGECFKSYLDRTINNTIAFLERYKKDDSVMFTFVFKT